MGFRKHNFGEGSEGRIAVTAHRGVARVWALLRRLFSGRSLNLACIGCGMTRAGGYSFADDHPSSIDVGPFCSQCFEGIQEMVLRWRAAGVPLLWNHDPSSKPLGSVSLVDRRLIVRMADDARVTRAMFFAAFNAGARFVKTEVVGGQEYVLEAEVFEVSIDDASPKSLLPPHWPDPPPNRVIREGDRGPR